MRDRISLQVWIVLTLMALLPSGCNALQLKPESTDPALIPSQSTPTIEPIESTEPPQIPTKAPIETPGHVYDNFEFDGEKRFYMVYVPDSYADMEKAPLVIYLHSYGWAAQTGMEYTQFNQIADKYDFLIAYPSAKYNWNSGIGDNPDWGTPDKDDVGFIDAMIDILIEDYRIDAEKIFATGYSNGGFMAYKLACQLSHRIAAIASVSGVFSTSTAFDCHPEREVPLLHIHGTNDAYVPMDGKTGWQSVAETLDFWIQNNGCTETETYNIEDIDQSDECTVEKILYSSCANQSQVIYYKVIGGGHTWPGAGPTGYPAGKTNQDMDAGEVIWNFFADYRLDLENGW